MRVLVTVGSTKFDDLISLIFTEPVLRTLAQHGYTDLSVQCGNSSFAQSSAVLRGEGDISVLEGVKVECWKFKPSLEEEYDQADLVISHAGSGTILDVLRRGKKLIVLPNETLLDNHQTELAVALEEKGYLVSCSVSGLVQAIQDVHKIKLEPFPAFDGSRFAELLDETMGFI